MDYKIWELFIKNSGCSEGFCPRCSFSSFSAGSASIKTLRCLKSTGGFFLLCGFLWGFGSLPHRFYHERKKDSQWSCSPRFSAELVFCARSEVYRVFVYRVTLCIGGLLHMRQDMDANMQIRIRRSMYHGIGWLVFSSLLLLLPFTTCRYSI